MRMRQHLGEGVAARLFHPESEGESAAMAQSTWQSAAHSKVSSLFFAKYFIEFYV